MPPPGAPLKPIPPAARWTARTLGWVLVAGFAASRIQDSGPISMTAALWSAGFAVAIALETHHWLPAQNTVAAAGMISLMAGAESLVRGTEASRALPVECLVWFSHVLAARGLVRLVLFPWRGRPGYGLGVLIGTTLVASVSLGLTRTAWGQAPTLGVWTLQTTTLGVAVLAASAWLLVKKPVPETPNARPAALCMALTCAQAWILHRHGHPYAGTLAVLLGIAGVVGVGASCITRRRPAAGGQ